VCSIITSLPAGSYRTRKTIDAPLLEHSMVGLSAGFFAQESETISHVENSFPKRHLL
jgi:hypothetical protein